MTDLMECTWRTDAHGNWVSHGLSGPLTARSTPLVSVTGLVGAERHITFIPAAVMADAVVVAGRCAGVEHDRAMTLRLVSARQLLENGQSTAAFVIAWFVVEAEAYHRRSAAPSNAGKKAPTTAEGVLKDLAATGSLDESRAGVLDCLRKMRNKVVHGEATATSDLARCCIAAAIDFVGFATIDVAGCYTFRW